MRSISQEKINGVELNGKPSDCTSFDIRSNDGLFVNSFIDLVTAIAKLSFNNPDYIPFFRGQRSDHGCADSNGTRISTICPSIFRDLKPDDPNRLSWDFDRLKNAEKELTRLWEFSGSESLKINRLLRWAILQHYEICDTPLLDVTSSVRVAASFASFNKDKRKRTGNCFVYVFAVPNLSGAITVNVEAGLQIVRLSSVCSPQALRPHIQDGYLIGEYPQIDSAEDPRAFRPSKLDWGRRLIGKFCFQPDTFWRDPDFPVIPASALYPDEDDPVFKLAKEIRALVQKT